MSAGATCEFACGWETGSTLELGWTNSVEEAAAPRTAVVLQAYAGGPTPPSGVVTGNYCLLCDNTAGKSGTEYRVLPSEALGGAVGFLWSPKTNATVVGGIYAIIFGIDNKALTGMTISWDDAQKLRVTNMDFAGSYTTYVTSANTYIPGNWYYLTLRWEKASSSYGLRTYHYSGGAWVVRETLMFSTQDFDSSSFISIRLGQLAGTTTSAWYIDNLYLMRGGGLWAPPVPNFAAGTVTDVSTNHTSWVLASGTDDATTEHLQIDEVGVTPDDTDYLKVTASSVAQPRQYFNLTDSLDAGGNILAVGVVGRHYQTSGGTRQQSDGIRLSGVSVETALEHVQDTAEARMDAAWGYQRQYFSSVNPSGAPWTAANLNAAEYILRGFNFGAGGEVRCSQAIVYCIYGTDSTPPTTMQRMACVS